MVFSQLFPSLLVEFYPFTTSNGVFVLNFCRGNVENNAEWIHREAAP